ncbi:MAG: fliM [Rhodocyclaceae bacterium]|nr:fliM [Rhodocyclaceae bacterium]
MDPRTLGRPVHLLRHFAAQLREDLAAAFHAGFNRRYRANFQVGEVTMAPMESTAPPGRWLAYGTSLGRIGYALERRVLLSVLTYRYGLADGEGGAGAAEPPPETVTEERLSAMLGLQLVNALAARVEAGAGDGEAPRQHEFGPLGPAGAPRGGWLVRTTVRETIHDVEGALCFALDDAWMARLLQKLAPERRGKARAPGAPLPARLHLNLVARLLQKHLSLGELLDIRVGDVIPVSLRATDVLIDDSRLFTATVAEHKGKLCLTSFEDAE